MLAILFIVFLIVVSTRIGMDFDASYNMLSYQSLFNGDGFNYKYNGKSIPFDPAISTGPELYAPVFLYWKIIGETNYVSAMHVVILFYVAFFVFLLSVVLKKTNHKTIGIITFLIYFFGDSNFFVDQLFILPKGEVICTFFLIVGFFLLSKNSKSLAGWFFLGFALDIKTNIMVGLYPTLIVFLFFEYYLTPLKKLDYKNLLKAGLYTIVSVSILLMPNYAYTRLIPELSLSTEQLKILKESQQVRKQFVVNRGLGHLVQIVKNPDKKGVEEYCNKLKDKLNTLQSFFGNSFILTLLFIVSFFLMMLFSYRQSHFSLYLLTIGAFISAWWIFAAGDGWYRYFSVVELLYVFSVVSLVPIIFSKMKKLSIFFILGTIILLSVFRFMPDRISYAFNQERKVNAFAMKNDIKDIDEETIFTYGWFQAPQLMLLTGKRFQDYLDKERLKEMRDKHGVLYFLSTIENTIIQDDMDAMAPLVKIEKQRGYNKLFRINEGR